MILTAETRSDNKHKAGTRLVLFRYISLICDAYAFKLCTRRVDCDTHMVETYCQRYKMSKRKKSLFTANITYRSFVLFLIMRSQNFGI